MHQLFQIGLSLLLAVALAASVRAEPPDDGRLTLFEKKIRPVLVEHCLECHGADEDPNGGLRLDSRDGWMAGGDSGPAIVPGAPAESRLLTALGYDDLELQMPPDGKLPDRLIEDLKQWIADGAFDPRTDTSPAARRTEPFDLEEARQHWAYQQPRRAPPPMVADATWPAGEIDRFILARLEAAGLKPAAEAEPTTLVRRLTIDLHGLPPTPEQVEEFLADTSPQGYSRLVDRLLASPRFGQRWGRHWLDVVRFGESHTLRGFVLPEAWRFRDYIIESLNEDRPFDQLIREHVAGDLLPADSIDQRRRQLIAATFLALGNTNLEDQDKEQLRMDVVDEQLEAIGRAFLAQTIGCARCHDHKFDPIPTRDYYALAGILRNTKTLEHANVSKWLEMPLPLPPEEQRKHDRHAAAVAALDQQIDEAVQLLAAEESAAESSPTDAGEDQERIQLAGLLKQLQQDRKNLIDSAAKRPMVMTVHEEKEITDCAVHIRGSVHNLGDVVPRGFLQVADHEGPRQLPSDESGRRQLAEWLSSPENPLTARVMANRTWHWLLGGGLVRTTDNFGATGESPSHPRLLDWLAVTFVEDGWSVKRLVRRIVLSRTYRQASATNVGDADPENRLLAHARAKRLDAECLRDAMLSVSGELDPRMGGPTIRDGTTEDYGYQHELMRRSVYLPVLRNALPEIFEVFDFANPSVVTGTRHVSTVAPQALLLMNHPWFYERARNAAERLLAETVDAGDLRRVELAFRRTLTRLPTSEEQRLAIEYVRNVSRTTAEDPLVEAYARLFHSLFATLDFRYSY